MQLSIDIESPHSAKYHKNLVEIASNYNICHLDQAEKLA